MHAPARKSLPRLALGLLLVLVPGLARAAWPHDPASPLPVCTAAGSQFEAAVLPDGAGGAVVAWADRRNGSDYDIYAQHLLGSGGVDPAWPANGRAVCTVGGDQGFPTLVSDGAGGVILAWQDARPSFGFTGIDIYAQHLLPDGSLDGAWPVGGRLVCGSLSDQTAPVAVSDGAGGAVLAWYDARNSGVVSFYASHLLATGVVDPAWTAGGVPVCTAGGSRRNLGLVSNAAGGAEALWIDQRVAGRADLYAQSVSSAGATGLPANGQAMNSTAASPDFPAVVSNGTGGLVVAWEDRRAGASNADIYARDLSGVGWPADGRAICTGAQNSTNAHAASDGAGGAIIAWDDTRAGTIGADIYAMHVLQSGDVDPLWPLNGRALCTNPQSQVTRAIVPDGDGGAIVVWVDTRVFNGDLYAQHVLYNGQVDPAWPVDGRGFRLTGPPETGPVACDDGAGGVICTWSEGDASFDLLAARVERFGRPGNPEPGVTAVADEPGDQGGFARVSWTRSYLDSLGGTTISGYRVWREAPASKVSAAIASGLRPPGPGNFPSRGDATHNRVRAIRRGTHVSYWELDGSTPATGASTYSLAVATTGDSVGASNPLTMFLVEAVATATSGGHWDSAPDSGYSVDNLAPAAPAPFTGLYTGTATHLHWPRSTEADVAGYRIYRGGSPAFVPGRTNLIAIPSDSGYTDPTPGSSCYKLSAVDSHGNESPFALLTPQQAGAVPGAAANATWLGRAVPTPARGPCNIRFALAHRGPASLTLLDATGRCVRTLAAGALDAGEHSVSWDGRDERGSRVESGVYFYRLETDGSVLHGRLVSLR